METTVEKLEVLMEDTDPICDTLFELTSSPVLAPPCALRQRLFKGYTIAPNTLAADCARYFLQVASAITSSTEKLSVEGSSDLESKRALLEVAEDRLTWLAAADVKYFIIPGLGEDTSAVAGMETPTQGSCAGGALAGEARPLSGVEFIERSTVDDAYLYDEDEI